MKDYMKTVEEFFWKNLEGEELQVSDDNFEVLEHAIRLMEIEDQSIANQEIESDSKLKTLFGFNNCEILNVIDEFSSEEQETPQGSENDYSEDSEDEQIYTGNFRMNNQEAPKTET